MFARKIGLDWEVYAPAKLNLYLEVLGRRTDGFHELETLMAPVAVYDRLAWSPPVRGGSPHFSLEYEPSTPAEIVAAAPVDESNLVWRAMHLAARAAGTACTGCLRLTKRIPVGSGMGGGSSDAAAALVLANAAWDLGLDRARLVELAAELGSDAPFFLAGQSAVCRGRGEIVEPVASLPRLFAVVVKPPASVSTAEAFRALDRTATAAVDPRDSARRLRDLMTFLQNGALFQAGMQMTNRLQAIATELCPRIGRLRDAFVRCRAVAHQMTGSGSAYFGLMRSAHHALRAARLLRSWNLGAVYAASTCR